MRSRVIPPIVLAMSLGGCSSPPRLVPLVGAGSAPVTTALSLTTPLEIVTRSTAAPDPLRVRGADVVYGDLEAALGIAVSTAVGPWAESERNHAVARSGGWSVLLEVTAADAELDSGGRIVVGIDVRATLKTRNGNVYLGQTQLGCREGGLASAEAGVPVVYRCMMRIGRDLAGWLGGAVPLDPPPPETE